MPIKCCKKLIATCLFACIALASQAQQRFFNLTREQVKIDSLLPHFGYGIALGEHFEDSTYSASILYPEFIDMSPSDVEKYMNISGEPLPEMPEIEQMVMKSRGKGTFSVRFQPLVYREGRHQILVSFMLKIESKAKDKALKSPKKAGSTGRYAENSVLANVSLINFVKTERSEPFSLFLIIMFK